MLTWKDCVPIPPQRWRCGVQGHVPGWWRNHSWGQRSSLWRLPRPLHRMASERSWNLNDGRRLMPARRSTIWPCRRSGGRKTYWVQVKLMRRLHCSGKLLNCIMITFSSSFFLSLASVSHLVSWCFEPSQPPGIILRLKETFIKRHIVERQR